MILLLNISGFTIRMLLVILPCVSYMSLARETGKPLPT